MTNVYFEEILAEAYNARDRGDHARVWALANQLLAMARSGWEKGEARSLLKWVAAKNPEAATKDPEIAVRTVRVASTPMRVTVVDFDMEFGSLVWLMVKAAIAAIPALAILIVIGILAGMFFGVLVGLG